MDAPIGRVEGWRCGRSGSLIGCMPGKALLVGSFGCLPYQCLARSLSYNASCQYQAKERETEWPDSGAQRSQRHISDISYGCTQAFSQRTPCGQYVFRPTSSIYNTKLQKQDALLCRESHENPYFSSHFSKHTSHSPSAHTQAPAAQDTPSSAAAASAAGADCHSPHSDSSTVSGDHSIHHLHCDSAA